ncbi:MAG: tRNA (adenosine(37)-N6)-threonylcarbamoyltransferase complex dimerization subunit type 1 TsaB, partial [Sphingopyxis sp.]|nr:tRNA (adenosine(37)-N6)-threonylcarbamoyltransferase complex dimerization subunit type 1 TsaB [Sphingopyxis sp.]
VQLFASGLPPPGAVRSLLPEEAVLADEALVFGNRAETFVARRGSGNALMALPDARAFSQLPAAALFDDPSPIYGRAPDAKPMACA